MSAAPVVFLDRDGTLIREREQPPRCAADVEFLAGAVEALAELRRAGLALVMVTNQSAIARGWLRYEEFEAVQAAVREALARQGVALDATYFCPHHPSAGFAPYRRNCECRKPGDALLRRAAKEFDLDLARSWMIGDAVRDLQAGQRVGARGILVATGKGQREAERLDPTARSEVSFAADLRAAASVVLKELNGARTPQGR